MLCLSLRETLLKGESRICPPSSPPVTAPWEGISALNLSQSLCPCFGTFSPLATNQILQLLSLRLMGESSSSPKTFICF